MKIHRFRNYDDMSQAAASQVMDLIAAKKNSLICTPTGGSPTGLYRQLAETAKRSPELFSSLRIVKLDEWLGVTADEHLTCERYLRTELLDPLGIAAERYIAFNGLAANPQMECERIQGELQRQGGVDLCILGLGVNGHLGFNEPGPFLQPNCHIAKLSKETLGHSMINAKGKKPEYGVTLGVGDILSSRKILLLIAGEGKGRVITELLSGKVTTSVPASFLLLHHDVEVLIDERSLSKN